MAFVNYNAWAEVVCTPVEFVYKIPDDMSFSEAAAFPMNFVTAYMMLFEVANLREGMSVLVHSAGGGVVSRLSSLKVMLWKWSDAQLKIGFLCELCISGSNLHLRGAHMVARATTDDGIGGGMSLIDGFSGT